MSVEKVALSGLLLAIMLILGYIESLIPPIVPIPGVKLGLSNGVLLFSLYLLNIPMTLVLMALNSLKTTGQFTMDPFSLPTRLVTENYPQAFT